MLDAEHSINLGNTAKLRRDPVLFLKARNLGVIRQPSIVLITLFWEIPSSLTGFVNNRVRNEL